MCQGPFLGCVAQEHADHGAHVVLNLNDKHLFVVADKNCTTAVGRQNSANLDWHNIFLHTDSVGDEREKTSPLSKRSRSACRKGSDAQIAAKQAPTSPGAPGRL